MFTRELELRSQSLKVEMEGIGLITYHHSSRARRVTIVLRPFRGVQVSVPRGVPFERAAAFVASKRPWIRENLLRLRRMEEEFTARKRVVPDLAPGKARARLVGRLAELAARHGYHFNRVTIRCQKTRWGSCSGQNNISLNLKLLALPAELMDFVLLHELIHTRIRNHGPEFWAELDRVAGQAREKAKRLRHYCLAAL
jgi:predicted metal-dependent hydrolase